MAIKKTVALIFGGKSAEHEVSINSAKNVYAAIDRSRFDVISLGISKDGQWFHISGETIKDLKQVKSTQESMQPVALIPGEKAKGKILFLKENRTQEFDVAVPILHGTYGEDGTIQGLFRIYDIPFVGCDVLGSALGMDKEVAKRLFVQAKIPNANFVTLYSHKQNEFSYQSLTTKLGVPFFIKPSNMGSSVGVHKIKSENEFNEKIKDAFQYDTKVLAEEFIKGREIECAVMGNENPKASIPGEILPQHEFYSYEAKYLDENGALLEMPAKLDTNTAKKVQAMAVQIYETLCCSGLARVDFFLKENGELYVNEINTIPGFTNISMYPKLWEHTGLPYSKLLTSLIELAFEKHEKINSLKTSFIN